MVVEFTISLGTISNFESFSKFEGLEAHFTPESEPLLKLRSHHLPLFCCVTPLARRVCAAAETSVTYLHREEYVSSLSANDGNSASFKAEANDLMTGVEKEERGTEKMMQTKKNTAHLKIHERKEKRRQQSQDARPRERAARQRDVGWLARELVAGAPQTGSRFPVNVDILTVRAKTRTIWDTALGPGRARRSRRSAHAWRRKFILADIKRSFRNLDIRIEEYIR